MKRGLILALLLAGCTEADSVPPTKLIIDEPGHNLVVIDYPDAARCTAAAMSLERQADTLAPDGKKSALNAYCIPG